MTREEFIEILDDKGYFYVEKGGKIVITCYKDIWMESIISLPLGIEFKNHGEVWLDSLTSIPPDVEFTNGRNVYLKFLIGGWFDEWSGNIQGIKPNRLLNKMIELGLFDKEKK
jgi:hypothetical protein